MTLRRGCVYHVAFLVRMTEGEPERHVSLSHYYPEDRMLVLGNKVLTEEDRHQVRAILADLIRTETCSDNFPNTEDIQLTSLTLQLAFDRMFYSCEVDRLFAEP